MTKYPNHFGNFELVNRKMAPARPTLNRTFVKIPSWSRPKVGTFNALPFTLSVTHRLVSGRQEIGITRAGLLCNAMQNSMMKDRQTYQSGWAGRVVGLAMGIGHQNLDFFAGEIARLHVGTDDRLHQLNFISKFGRKWTLSQSGVHRLHGRQNLGLFPLRYTTKSNSYKNKSNQLKKWNPHTQNHFQFTHHYYQGLQLKVFLKLAILLLRNDPSFIP